MAKRITLITLLLLTIVTTLLLLASTTYSVIIDVTDKENKIISNINIKDLVTNEDGTYNNRFYDILYELEISIDEANIIIDSVPLNKALDILLNSINEYQKYNKNKLTNNEIYNIIVSTINEDDNINTILKNKLIKELKKHIDDISTYLYNIKL